MNIIHHPYRSVAITQVLAFSPQNRLIKIVWLVGYQPNLHKNYENSNVNNQLPKGRKEENGREGVLFSSNQMISPIK